MSYPDKLPLCFIVTDNYQSKIMAYRVFLVFHGFPSHLAKISSLSFWRRFLRSSSTSFQLAY